MNKAHTIIVTPRTFVVSKAGQSAVRQAFACLQAPDSVVVKVAVPAAQGTRVVFAHLNDGILEHPTTCAVLKAAKLPVKEGAARALGTIFCVDYDKGLATKNALGRETGIRRILYRVEPVAWGSWIGVDLQSGIRREWSDVLLRTQGLQALEPPRPFSDKLKLLGYRMRNSVWLRWAKNPVYADNFPVFDAKREARRYSL